MIQGLLFFFLLIFIVGFVVIVVVAATAIRFFQKAKRMVSGEGKDKKFNKGSRTATVVDTRHEDIAKRKIFPKEEGEYVDFTEQ